MSGRVFVADATDFDDFRAGGWNVRYIGIVLIMVAMGELGLLLFAYPVSALPQIAAHYRTSQVGWVATTFLLVAALVSAMTGTLADRYGKKRLLMAQLVSVIVGLLVSASAPTFAILLVGRVLQAPILTFPFLLPSLARDIFPTRTVPMAAALTVTGAGVLSVPAQIYGGDMIEHLGFRSVFWLPAIVAVVLLVAMAVGIPESGVRHRTGRIDVVGAALLGGGVALVLTGVTFGPVWGWTSARVLAAMALGVASMVAWGFQALHVKDPLVDLRELGTAPLLTAMLFAGIGTAMGAWLLVVMPVIAQSPSSIGGLGLDPTQETHLAALFPLGGSIAGLAVGYSLRRRAAGTVAIASVVVLVAGYALAYLGPSSPTMFAVATLAVGMGGAASTTVAYNLIIKLVAPERQAVMSATFSLFFSLLSSVVAVVLFAVMNSLGTTDPASGRVIYGPSALDAATLIPLALSLVGVVCASGLWLTRAGRGARKPWRCAQPWTPPTPQRRLSVVKS